jgi:hypothetical protein
MFDVDHVDVDRFDVDRFDVGHVLFINISCYDDIMHYFMENSI